VGGDFFTKATGMKHFITSVLGSHLLRFLHWSIQWEREGLEVNGIHWSFGQPSILTVWHGDQLMAPWAYRISHWRYSNSGPQPYFLRSLPLGGNAPRKLKALTSLHSDGRLIAGILERLGLYNIGGSSSRGAVKALLTMRKTIEKEQCHLAITPDGPRGPIWKVKLGVISVASMTGAPIIPVAFGYERSWSVKSWDKMIIPKPGTRGRLIGGNPFFVPKNISAEELTEYALRLEEELNRLKEVASRTFMKK